MIASVKTIKIVLVRPELSPYERLRSMSRENRLPSSEPIGSVEVREIPNVDGEPNLASHLIRSRQIYTWRPSSEIEGELSKGIRLECWDVKDGIRRFRLLDPFDVFILRASLAGDLSLSRERSDEQSTPLSYDEMRLFNQFVRHSQEYLGQTLKLGRALHISPAGRPDRGTKDVLPCSIGLNRHGDGVRWTVGNLKDEGLRAAMAAGIQNPTIDQIAWYGLYVAAMADPLHETNPEKIEQLFRLAFFTLGGNIRQHDPAIIQYVIEQLRASLCDHIDDSTEEFNRWIENRGSNLVNRIVRRKGCCWRRRKSAPRLPNSDGDPSRALVNASMHFSACFNRCCPSRSAPMKRDSFAHLSRSTRPGRFAADHAP